MMTFKKAYVSVVLVRHLKHYAEQRGITLNTLSDATGIDLNSYSAGHKQMSAHQFNLVWRQLAIFANDPHPGLSLGLEVIKGYPGGSILFTMMMNCPTVGRALDVFVRYHRLMADAVQPRIDRQGEVILLSWEGASNAIGPRPDLSEALVCVFLGIVTHLSQGRLKPIEVGFTHAEPQDTRAYEQVFKAPIRFNAPRDGLVLALDALSFEIRLADRELFSVLEHHANHLLDAMDGETRWTREVMKCIREMLLEGIRPDINAVSKKLAMSRRTLQAKLNTEVTTYRNCLEAVRKQMALEIITRPGVAISEVAFLLGYSEQSAFNHAFKRWTGKSPKAMRETV